MNLKRRKRYALDASVLVPIVNSDDVEHFSCYSFFQNLHQDDSATWVVPGLMFFEFQATQSKLSRKRRSKHRVLRQPPLSYENTELYHVTKKFLMKVHELDLYNKFSLLHGADLLYACIARVEDIPLVTHDKDFDPYSKELTLISPREIYGTGNTPLETGTVTVKKTGKTYTVGYSVFRGVVELETGQATHTVGPGAEMIARQLLREIVDSGLADQKKLGR
jgi:predicted nucleic acid-binding protein